MEQRSDIQSKYARGKAALHPNNGRKSMGLLPSARVRAKETGKASGRGRRGMQWSNPRVASARQGDHILGSSGISSTQRTQRLRHNTRKITLFELAPDGTMRPQLAAQQLSTDHLVPVEGAAKNSLRVSNPLNPRLSRHQLKAEATETWEEYKKLGFE